jgi:hypothetical protein
MPGEGGKKKKEEGRRRSLTGALRIITVKTKLATNITLESINLEFVNQDKTTTHEKYNTPSFNKIRDMDPPPPPLAPLREEAPRPWVIATPFNPHTEYSVLERVRTRTSVS